MFSEDRSIIFGGLRAPIFGRNWGYLDVRAHLNNNIYIYIYIYIYSSTSKRPARTIAAPTGCATTCTAPVEGDAESILGTRLCGDNLGWFLSGGYMGARAKILVLVGLGSSPAKLDPQTPRPQCLFRPPRFRRPEIGRTLKAHFFTLEV